MVLSKEHKALIKSLYELKCCNARQFMMEYPQTGWRKCSIDSCCRSWEMMVQSTVTWSSTSLTHGQMYHKSIISAAVINGEVVTCMQEGKWTSLWMSAKLNQLSEMLTSGKCPWCEQSASLTLTLHTTLAWQSTADWWWPIKLLQSAGQHTSSFANYGGSPGLCWPTLQKPWYKHLSCAIWTTAVCYCMASLMV